MRKLLIGLIAVSGFLFVSCSKDYNCECTVEHVEENTNPAATISSTHTESTHSTMTGKEDEVRSACKNSGFNMSYKDDLDTKHTITSVCKIK